MRERADKKATYAARGTLNLHVPNAGASAAVADGVPF